MSKIEKWKIEWAKNFKKKNFLHSVGKKFFKVEKVCRYFMED